MFHRVLSVPSFGSFRPHHDRHDLDAVGVEGRSVVVTAVVWTFVGDTEADSARVTSSAKRNRSSKAIRSSAALSRAADASTSGIGLADPYAHEPATTAATVNPCATMRNRSQLLNERDWPLRILVIAITSATVVAAAPVRVRFHKSASPQPWTLETNIDRQSRTDRDEGLLLEFSQCLFAIGFSGDRGMSGHGVRDWCEWRTVTVSCFLI